MNVRTIASRSAGALLFAFCLAGVAHADANLILNPSLETASGGVPAQWSKQYWGSPAPTFTYPVAGHTGNGASVAFTKNSSGDARWAHDLVAVEPGATYTFSIWYTSNVTTEINTQYVKSNNKVSWGYVAAIPSSGNTWKQFTVDITIPSDVTKASVFQLIKKKGILTIDDISFVKKGTTPTPDPTPTPTPDPTPTPTPTLTFSVSPNAITAGQSATLSWSAANATSCTASNGWSGAKGTSGNQNVNPSATTVYVLSCSGTGGSVVKDATITVSDAPAPSDPSQFAEGMVTISFDDAWRSQYTNALPILNNAGLKGTFYILTQPVQGGWADYMTPAQVQTIANAGHEMGGHTVTHSDLTTLSNSKINTEIQNSKTYIENLTGKTVHSLAYPYGSYNTKVVNRTKSAGYTNARTADPTTALGFNTKQTPIYELNSFSPTTGVSVATMKAAIDKAKAEKKWFIFSIHEVEDGNSDEYATTVARFQEIVDYVKTSGIKTVTVEEGVALMK